jgi:hypothetical protein
MKTNMAMVDMKYMRLSLSKGNHQMASSLPSAQAAKAVAPTATICMYIGVYTYVYENREVLIEVDRKNTHSDII